MPLVPGIHVLELDADKDVDGRDKPGHDELLYPRYVHINPWIVLDGLVHNAIAFGKFEQLIEFFLRCIGVDIEAQTNLRKAYWCILGNAQRAAEVEIAFCRYASRFQWNI
jgi:hypothetical protein